MTKHDRSDEKVCETSPCRQAPCRRLLVCCPENHLPSINWETKLGKQFPFGGSLPLFPACTHADCRRNYEMEESSGEAGRAPNRRSRPAPDASPSPKPRTKPKTICRRALFPAGSKLPSTSIQATWSCSLNLPLLTRLTTSWCAVPELN